MGIFTCTAECGCESMSVTYERDLLPEMSRFCDSHNISVAGNRVQYRLGPMLKPYLKNEFRILTGRFCEVEVVTPIRFIYRNRTNSSYREPVWQIRLKLESEEIDELIKNCRVYYIGVMESQPSILKESATSVLLIGRFFWDCLDINWKK